jgi:putative transposase
MADERSQYAYPQDEESHLIRNSLVFASRKERKLVAAALRPVYTAPTAEAAAQCLPEFEAGPWGAKFPTIAASWRRVWEHVIPFFAFRARGSPRDVHDG